jgi:hypothetical protein
MSIEVDEAISRIIESSILFLAVRRSVGSGELRTFEAPSEFTVFALRS